MRIALAGNPNSGKTTMYNGLTGRNEQVGNWAGVTVDKKEAPIRKLYGGAEKGIVVDLPGAYSLSPFTSEESITSDFVRSERLDVMINIVDATNLSRSLFFTTQLLELGIPMVVALNKTDINEKKKTVIDVAGLSEKLGCPVLETASATRTGLEDLVQVAVAQAGKTREPAETTMSDQDRYAYVNEIVSAVEQRRVKTYQRNTQDRIDDILTNRFFGIPIFALVMFLVFQISQAWVGPWIAEGYTFASGISIPGLVTLIDLFKEWVAGLLVAGHPFLVAMLTEGIIGGVSAVVGFLPLVMVMYFLIALLEDCGYMARATVVLDPIFKKVGLSGKSVIPFVMGTGCAIPGVMACRTIRSEQERRATALLAPFMPCGAKLPVIALFAGAFFGEASWVGTLMYFAGIAVILVGALLVNAVTGCKIRRSFFIIELPEYKVPSLKRAGVSMLQRGWEYVVKAGTIILLCNAAVYIMQSFNWQLQIVPEGRESTSILATVAQPFAYILMPIVGYHAWQLAAAAVTGFIAKENVVGTLAVCYAFAVNEDLEAAGGNEVAAAMVGMTKVAALAYLMFNLFTPPCFAAIGAMRAELKSKKWLFGGIALQLATGFTIGYLVYTVGTLLVSPKSLHVPAAVWGLVVILGFVATLLVLTHRAKKKG